MKGVHRADSLPYGRLYGNPYDMIAYNVGESSIVMKVFSAYLAN